MKEEYLWHSEISSMLIAYLNEKRMTGFKFNRQEHHLKKFDEYYFRNGYSGSRLTKPMLDGFIYLAEERPSSYYLKERLMHDFAKFLMKNGCHEVYVPEIKSAPQNQDTHIPYIFTEDEMAQIFHAIDSWKDSFYTNRSVIDPVFFRLLYGTGMRVSEALNLLVRDFNPTEGILTIYHAKNNKDRLIPLTSSLTERVIKLKEKIHRYSSDGAYLFTTKNNNKIDQSTIYRRFRDYLQSAGISHSDAGPRVHDFRHNFAVKCLKDWVLSGEELTNLLPYLAAYMGHSDFRGTQYYLRLTADMYPNIINRIEADFGYVIPEGGGFDE